MGMHLIAAGWISWLIWLFTPANWPTVAAVAAGLGFVIFVHELGHFLVAKACGVKCEKFYLGFDIYGLKLVKFQWGETEYGIGILPLGGYVKMLGQDDNPARIAEENRRARESSQTNELSGGGAGATGVNHKHHHTLAESDHAPHMTHGDLPPEPVSDPHEPYDPRSYMAQSVPKRMAIISAGVIMNVIFAFIMASVAYALGVKETPCIVRGVIPGGAAWQSDLQPGDVITRVGKIENPRFRDLQTGVTLGNLEHGVSFSIDRPGDEKPIDLTLYPDTSLGVPLIGIVGPWRTDLVDQPGVPAALKYSPAGEAKPIFMPGDNLVQINDMPIHTQADIDRAMIRYIDEPIQVKVERKKTSTNAKGLNNSSKDNSTQVDTGKESTNGQDQFERLTIEVQPTAMRSFDMVMAIGPIDSVQKNSPAEDAGLKAGDAIDTIDGQPVGNPLTLPARMRAAAAAGKTVKFRVTRSVDGKPQQMPIDVKPREPKYYDVLLPMNPMSAPALGIAYKVPTDVSAVEPNSPAAGVDIKPGDKIVAVEIVLPPKKEGDDEEDYGEPSRVQFDERDPAWPFFIYEQLPFTMPNAKFKLTVEREGATHDVEVGPEETKLADGKAVHVPTRGFIFQPLTTTRTANSVGEAVGLGGQETLDSLLLVYRFLQKIGQKQIPITALGGPVEIARQAGAKVHEGLAAFLLFLTMLSANLAVVNFLPIPVLDGGHMVFLLYEGLRGKPASERVIVGFTYAGMAFILSLMLFVLSLDLHIISRR